jgi:hypothetical protein
VWLNVVKWNEQHYKRVEKEIQITLLATLLIMSVGCSAKNYQDISNSISFQPLPVPEGEYTSVAWLDEDHIVYIYKPEELASNDLNTDFRIGIFEIFTDTTKDLTAHHSMPDCYLKRSRISNLSRVPNGSLGIMLNCASSGDSLYLLNPDSMEIVKRQTYLGFIAKDFSFSPDMSQLVQENGNGDGLSEKLLLVSSDKTIKELPDFRERDLPHGHQMVKH